MGEIKVEHVSKKFGNIIALNDASFTVPDGAFAVLVGPSGCGKTTLLRCVAGLENPDSGEIYIDSRPVSQLSPRERDVAMIFQSFSLFPHMSAAQNIGFPLRVRGVPRTTVNKRISELAELLGIKAILERAPRELSGGEQQRVAIGRALARQPKAFLMDEPLSSLDAPLRAQLRSDLKQLQRELRVTTLYVTHDQSEAFALADRVGVMNRGTLLQYDTAQRVFQHPSEVFVARFVGDPQANLIDVDLKRGTPTDYIEGDGFKYPIPGRVGLNESFMDPRAFTVSIRPEDVQISKSPSDEYSIRAQVKLVEPLTLYKLVSARSGGTDFRVLASKDQTIDVGDQVWLRIDAGKIRFFDRKTGRSESE